ncbi:E3 ubiquitin-protein ligase RNF182 [Brachyhypopomus gauderio]|uniref:E3 ubiquitin-protein ligase RNF182 n=1 Tax=Brachyhypopomus gauderio TaxID=698409 RepID=UPI004041A337
MQQALEEPADDVGLEELECKICYCAYSPTDGQPRVLECHHRMCAKCLAKMVDLSESSPRAVVCPFCRCVTNLPAGSVGSLPNHYNLLMELSTQDCRPDASQPEILATSGHVTGGFVSTWSARSVGAVITTVRPPWDPDILPSREGRSSRAYSLGSVVSVTWYWVVWRCVARLCQNLAQALVWLLAVLYLGSLPLGVYMLTLQETSLGVLLVCLVPVSLLLAMLYGLCYCMCRGFWNWVLP